MNSFDRIVKSVPAIPCLHPSRDAEMLNINAFANFNKFMCRYAHGFNLSATACDLSGIVAVQFNALAEDMRVDLYYIKEKYHVDIVFKDVCISSGPVDDYSGYLATALLMSFKDCDLDIFKTSRLSDKGFIYLDANESLIQLLCFPDDSCFSSTLDLPVNEVPFVGPVVGRFILGAELFAASEFVSIHTDSEKVADLKKPSKVTVCSLDKLAPGNTFYYAGDTYHVAVIADNIIHTICSTTDYESAQFNINDTKVAVKL